MCASSWARKPVTAAVAAMAKVLSDRKPERLETPAKRLRLPMITIRSNVRTANAIARSRISMPEVVWTTGGVGYAVVVYE